jgi:small ligand-binding sensory domain FIST
MKWASTLSLEPDLGSAVEEAAAAAEVRLDGRSPDLAVVFVAANHAPRFDELPRLLKERLHARVIIGCSAGGVIGDAREIEHQPGLSLTVAVLPGVDLHPFHVESEVLRTADVTLGIWPQGRGARPGEQPHFLLFPDPFSFDAEAFLRALDRAYPQSRKIGGLASGGRQPGSNILVLGNGIHRSGAVGVALSGAVSVEAIVAQGCRPIGQPMFVTRCDRNVLWEIDGRRPLDVLREIHAGLAPEDRALAQHSLFVGLAMSDDQQEFRRGDFLIRNLIGADGESGAMALGALLQPAAVVQFHLRDARTSAEDLEALLGRHRIEKPDSKPAGCLLFSCLGRGRHLYGCPDHDSDAFRRHLGPVPLGGFFCNGEIGPVRGMTFLHGYTSVFGLFSAPR